MSPITKLSKTSDDQFENTTSKWLKRNNFGTPIPFMFSITNDWLQLLATLAGIAVILIPLFGFRHAQVQVRGRSSGAAARSLRWPVMFAFTFGCVVVGIALWRPLPIILSPRQLNIVSIIGSLLYFPGIVLYLWGCRTPGRMFGISSGFGATLYQDHHLIRRRPYGYLHHPMCLAVILTALVALLIFRIWAMVLFSASSLVVIVCARWEEKLLAEEFGEERESYKWDVDSFSPLIFLRLFSHLVIPFS